MNRYGSTFPVQSPVPTGLSDWTSTRILGVSPIFWIGVGLTLVLIVGLRYTAVGRRFQAVGANPVASHVVGVRVSLNQILVYVVAAVFYAIAGVALAGLLRTPGVAVGTTYLLGPIAAVVIGGASLTGGLASPLVHVRRRLLPHGSEPDAANDGAAHRPPVRRVRSGHHRRHVGLGRSDHPGRRAAAPRAETTGSLAGRDPRRLRRRTCLEGGGYVTLHRSVTPESIDRVARAIDQGEEEHETEQDHRHRRRAGVGRSGM